MEASVHRLLVKIRGTISFLAPGEIDWVEAKGDYVCFVSHGVRHLHREKISRLEELHSFHLFVRIHRSFIVNIERIREMQPRDSGDYDIVLLDGTRLALSRSYRGKVLRHLLAAS